MSGPKHDHPANERCHLICPNRLANLARSQKKRCPMCNRINCPIIGHHGWVL
jgi:hypothetical protein